MDSDRKYKQHGYLDVDRPTNGFGRDDRPKQQGPRPPLDVTGPRLPRMVQTLTASRCYNCATALPSDYDFKGNCPKCSVALHCCKQCTHFEPSTRFQCMKPVPERIVYKDRENTCELFRPRVTVARDVKSGTAPVVSAPVPQQATPRSQSDARAAFDSLFKKDS